MSDQTTLEVVLSSESTVGNPIIETVTVLGTVPIGPRGLAAVNDGDKGDIVVSGSGTVWTIEAGAVTAAKVAADVATQAELDAVSAAIPSTEAIQDVVGAMATDSTTVNFTYDDTAGTLTAVVQGLASTDISDFAEAVRDRLAPTLVEGAGIDITVDDPGDTVTIATTITQYTDEMARDAIGAALVAGNNIDITVDDAGNTITVDVEALTTADLSDFATAVDERARDALGSALVAGTNITITPNDGANTITIDATGGSSYTDENAQDAVGTILADSATIDFTYTDATPEITAIVKDGSITAAKVAADVATQAELDAKVSDTAYDATSWNGVTDVAPSKNAVRDELEATTAEIATAIADGDASTLTSANAHSDALVSDTAYNAGTWDGDTTHAPSKNAVRDKIESLGSASVSDTAYAGSWDGVTTIAPSKNAVYDKIEALAAAKQDASSDLTDLVARWVAASASGPASLDFLEDTDNGSNKATLIAPASMAGDRTVTLPDATGTLITGAQADAAYAPIGRGQFKQTRLVGATNRTTTSSTFTPIDSTNLGYLTLDLAVGDVVRLVLQAQALDNSGNGAGFNFEVDQPTSANVNASSRANGFMLISANTSRIPLQVEGRFTATEAGTHGFRPIWRSAGSTTVTLYNGTSGIDDTEILFYVEKVGPPTA